MRSSGHNWRVLYHPSIKKDILHLGAKDLVIIRNVIERRLLTNPILYGVPLRGSLKQLWKVTVGNFRIVFSLEKNSVRVLVIGHRRDIYKLADRRK